MLHMYKIKKTTDRSDKHKIEYEFINKHKKHLKDPNHQKKIDQFEESNSGELALHLRAEKELLVRM